MSAAFCEAEPSLEHLQKVLGFIDLHSRALGLSATTCRRIQLVVEEVFVNIVKHGSPPATLPILIYFRSLSAPYGAEVVVKDFGCAFDPVTQGPTPKLGAGLDEREPGGLGVYLIDKLASECGYVRENKQNVLTLVFTEVT